MDLEQAELQIGFEYDRASKKFPPFRSYHEGLAIIQEEVFELQTEIYKKAEEGSLKKMQEEAIQVGAMALRFLVDLCEEV